MVERGSERIEFLNVGDPVKNILIDLSTSGAAFSHSIKVKEDDCLRVKIQDHEIEARVVYCQPKEGGFRIGLQFKDISPIIRKCLQAFIEDFSRGVPLSCEIQEREKQEEAKEETRKEA